MRIDEAGQNELARSVDDHIIWGFGLELAAGSADMSDPVSLDHDARIRDRVAAGSVDQCPVLDQQTRRGTCHGVASLYELQRG